MNTLQADYKRFCAQHSWYKHIPLEGQEFYAYQAQGEQPRNGIFPEVSDPDGMHWHFTTRRPEQPSLAVRFGPFLRGIECYSYDNKAVIRGFHIIVSIAGDAFQQWVAANYPHLAHIDWKSLRVHWEASAAIEDLYKTECNRYWRDLVTAYKASAFYAGDADP